MQKGTENLLYSKHIAFDMSCGNICCAGLYLMQVQVQEAGEGVATGKGVGPWTVSERSAVTKVFLKVERKQGTLF